MIQMGLGMDITNLFDSYHKIDSVKMMGTEKVPQVGVLITNKYPPYERKNNENDFYPTLKRRVEKFLNEKKYDPREISTFNAFNTIFIYTVYIYCIVNSLFIGVIFFFYIKRVGLFYKEQCWQ
jgi:hypothetical protein